MGEPALLIDKKISVVIQGTIAQKVRSEVYSG